MIHQVPLADALALATPCALVDLQRLDSNIATMNRRLASTPVRLCPHVKTHKSLDIARRQVAGHFGGIMVSTLAEAHHFAAAGFEEIVYGVPLAVQRIGEVLSLAKTLRRLSVLVDHPATVEALAKAALAAQQRVSVFLKVDCGYHRAGVDPTSNASVQLAQRIASAPALALQGILTHSGHAYDCRTATAARQVGDAEARLMTAFAAQLRAAGVEVEHISIGSTPTLSAGSSVAGVTEVRPGNYIFYDAFQATLGSCNLNDAAFTVLVTVLSHYPEQNKLLIDAGSIALSKDVGAPDLQPELGYGALFEASTGRHLPHLRLFSLSQEHGQISGCGPADFASLPIGARLRIVPNHACLTAAQYKEYYVVAGGEIAETWGAVRGW